jgi:hypothetical protein
MPSLTGQAKPQDISPRYDVPFPGRAADQPFGQHFGMVQLGSDEWIAPMLKRNE